MALNGVGEPAPNMLQTATQLVTIEFFRQWQTYQNGVHLDWDTFRSIDFEALALEALSSAGLTFTAGQVAGASPDPLDNVTLAGTTHAPRV